MILVTGATGVVGRQVVEELTGRGDRVRALSRGPLDAGLAALGVEPCRGDLLDPASLACLDGVESVVHLAAAGLGADAGPGQLWAVNVDATRALARAARERGVDRFVHVSSAGVYGDSGTAAPLDETSPPAPVNAYQRSKLEGEQVVQSELAGASTSLVILRPYGIYGPGRPKGIELFREVARRRLWLYGPTRVVIHPTHVRDASQAVLSALDRCRRDGVRGEVFNVGGERSLEHYAFVRLLADRMGVRVSRVALPRPSARAFHALGALGVRGAARFGRRSIVYAVDTSKACSRLGFVPFPFDQGVDETIAWARARGLLLR